jgi:hypothetical protein
LNELGSEGGVVDSLVVEFEGGNESFLGEEGSFLGFIVIAWGEVGSAG